MTMMCHGCGARVCDCDENPLRAAIGIVRPPMSRLWKLAAKVWHDKSARTFRAWAAAHENEERYQRERDDADRRADAAEARAERYRAALVSLDESGHLTPVVRAIVDAALTEPE